jgi:hypothetical protein
VQSSVTADKDGAIHATVAVPIRIDAATYALTAIGAASQIAGHRNGHGARAAAATGVHPLVRPVIDTFDESTRGT